MPLPTADAARYVIDTQASQLTVQVFATNLGAVFAHNPKIAIRNWSGGMQIDSNGLSNSSLRLKVHANSLEVLDDIREDDRREIHRVMTNDVLEAGKAFMQKPFMLDGLARKLREILG